MELIESIRMWMFLESHESSLTRVLGTISVPLAARRSGWSAWRSAMVPVVLLGKFASG